MMERRPRDANHYMGETVNELELGKPLQIVPPYIMLFPQLLSRFQHNQTIGFTTTLPISTLVKVHLFDTAILERYKAIRSISWSFWK